MKALCVICFLTLSVGSALAQTTGTIVGRVLDTDGDPVPSGTIQARNSVTAAMYPSAIAAGNYSLTGLPPGTYDVSIAAMSFVRFEKKGVMVTAGGATRVDIILQPVSLGDDITELSNEMRADPVPTGPAPRMPDGKPDLSGLWLNVTDGNPAPPLQLQPWAETIRIERVKNPSKMPQTLCLPNGPIQIASIFPYKLVQSKSEIVMLTEIDVAMVRQIFLDGRPHPDPKTGQIGTRAWNPSWLGHSVGKWEGDTLVVDTVGFNDRGWLMMAPYTQQLHVVERIRRPDLGHLDINVTAEDPGAFLAPWKRHLVATIAAKDEEIEEYICSEGNIDPEHLK